MKGKLKQLIIVMLPVVLFGCSTSGSLKPTLNNPVYLKPKYNNKLGVLIFDDERFESQKELDSAFINLPVNEAISAYFADDLNHSNIFSKVIYIDKEKPYDIEGYKKLQKEYAIDLLLVGEIEEFTLEGKDSPSVGTCLLNAPILPIWPFWLLFNSMGLPIPPYAKEYYPTIKVDATIYDLDTMESRNYYVIKKGERFISPATFWYLIMTDGKIEELGNIVKIGSLEQIKKIQSASFSFEESN